MAFKFSKLLNNQIIILGIEYNAFSKAKFGNFQKLLKLNNYLQKIIIGEKKRHLNSSLPQSAPLGPPSAQLGSYFFGNYFFAAFLVTVGRWSLIEISDK